MKIECNICGYHYQDDIILHDGPNFIKSICGEIKGNLLLHNEPFMKIVDSEYCKCPNCKSFIDKEKLLFN
jgi:rubredoxin